MKTLIIVLCCVLAAVVIIYIIWRGQYEETKFQVDALYTYFHKIQDSIKAKHYPINMDSLKRQVHDSMMTLKVWSNLQQLEESVRAYKQP